MGKERREKQELHEQYGKHEVYVLNGGHEVGAAQWGYCECGKIFRRPERKLGDMDLPWEAMTWRKALGYCLERRWDPGWAELRREIMYCKRIGMR